MVSRLRTAPARCAAQAAEMMSGYPSRESPVRENDPSESPGLDAARFHPDAAASAAAAPIPIGRRLPARARTASIERAKQSRRRAHQNEAQHRAIPITTYAIA